MTATIWLEARWHKFQAATRAIERASAANRIDREIAVAKPIPAFVIQAAGGSIAPPYLAAIATSFPVSGMAATETAFSSAKHAAAWEPTASAICAVYLGNRLMSLNIRALVDHLARCFGKPPYGDAGL
jgi:DNA-binding transcriptional LysR family regulator